MDSACADGVAWSDTYVSSRSWLGVTSDALPLVKHKATSACADGVACCIPSVVGSIRALWGATSDAARYAIRSSVYTVG
jgi:hypothetical protein